MEPSASAPEGAGRTTTLSHLTLWLAVLVGLVVAWRTHADYGPTWDEGVQARYGELALDYFESGGTDRACDEYLDLRFYGPLIEMIPALFHDGGPDGVTAEVYALRHLVLGLLAALSLPAIWLFARGLERGGQLPGVAAFAVLGLATLPRLYAHVFNNSKDASFALAVLWFMAALAAFCQGERLRWGRALLLGLAVGLGLCMRPGGLPLFVLFTGCGALAWILTRPHEDATPLAARLRDLVPKLLVALVLAWVVMVLPWPWAHRSPLAHPIEAIRKAAAFPTTVPVLFDGERILSDRLPWNYLTRYLLITTPVPLLVLAAVGLVLGVRLQLTAWCSRTARLLAITQVWLFAPLALFVLVRPNIHGGLRHFLFVLPAIAVFAAYGAARVLGWMHGEGARRAGALALAVLLVLPARELVRLHPYQVAYYNELVGGVAGAQETDWTDYYLSSYAEAVRWVSEQAAATPELETRVWISAGESTVLWARAYAGPNVDLSAVQSLEERPTSLEADYYITSTRFGTGHFPEAPIVHTVSREGVAFTVIKGKAETPRLEPLER